MLRKAYWNKCKSYLLESFFPESQPDFLSPFESSLFDIKFIVHLNNIGESFLFFRNKLKLFAESFHDSKWQKINLPISKKSVLKELFEFILEFS